MYREIGFLFDTDDGSLPELRITRLLADQTPVVYGRLRELASRINEGAYFWDRKAERDAPVDSVPNAATLMISGEAAAGLAEQAADAVEECRRVAAHEAAPAAVLRSGARA